MSPTPNCWSISSSIFARFSASSFCCWILRDLFTQLDTSSSSSVAHSAMVRTWAKRSSIFLFSRRSSILRFSSSVFFFSRIFSVQSETNRNNNASIYRLDTCRNMHIFLLRNINLHIFLLRNINASIYRLDTCRNMHIFLVGRCAWIVAFTPRIERFQPEFHSNSVCLFNGDRSIVCWRSSDRRGSSFS